MNNNNTAVHEQIQKMATSVKVVAFLSLAVNAYEVYQYIKEPTDVEHLIGIVVGIMGTPLLWFFGSQLQSKRKRALLLWIGISVVGLARVIISSDPFLLNISSILLIGLWTGLSTRLVVWTRAKVLV